MKSALKKALENSSAEYSDAMFHELRRTSIVYNKKEMSSVSNIGISGGRISVINGGGVGAASFTSLSDINEAVKEADTGARAVNRFGVQNRLAPAPVVKDSIKLSPPTDPRDVSFDEKCRLMEEYTDVLLNIKGIFTTTMAYHEAVNVKTFVNSEGSEIEQEEIICRLGGRIIAKDGSRQEMTGFSFGFDTDFSRLRGREAELEKKARIALELLKAEPVKGGAYKAICNPELGGLFIHEAFGHLSESDDVVHNPSLQTLLPLGKTIGAPNLNVIDQGDLPGAPGTFAYDEEGIKGQKTYLVRNGVLVGRLMSRLTAGLLGGEPTGNYRAMDYRFFPLVRMSNIFIDAGDSSFEEMLDTVSDGLYLCGGKGGQTMGDIFTFGAQYGYKIKNGKLNGMIKDVNISGNVMETLAGIFMIGDELIMNESGGCGKSRAANYDLQMLDKSGLGSPYIAIKNVMIGG